MIDSVILNTALITCFFSFGVQSLFYLYYYLSQSSLIRDYKTVFDYSSGIIGDGLLVPLVNVFAVLSLWQSPGGFNDYYLWVISLGCGFLITLLMHYGQQRFTLTNWTMPRVGKWNKLGIYHAFFMLFESAFLSYALLSYLRDLITQGPGFTYHAPIKLGIFIFLMFVGTFVYDYWQCLFRNGYVNYVRPVFDHALRRGRE